MHLLFAFFASETIKWLNYNSLGLMLLLCFVLLLSRLICAHVLVYPLSSISIKYLMNVYVRHLVWIWTGNSLFAMSGHSPVVLCSVGLIEKIIINLWSDTVFFRYCFYIINELLLGVSAVRSKIITMKSEWAFIQVWRRSRFEKTIRIYHFKNELIFGKVLLF